MNDVADWSSVGWPQAIACAEYAVQQQDNDRTTDGLKFQAFWDGRNAMLTGKQLNDLAWYRAA